jgi:Cu-Zn family superoxide dismutase
MFFNSSKALINFIFERSCMNFSHLKFIHRYCNKSSTGGATSLSIVLVLICVSILNGCSTLNEMPNAQAMLDAKSGSTVTGTATLNRRAGGVLLVVDVNGLPPNHINGFHVHEKGDCSAPDAISAGGHFNPDHVEHGNPRIDSAVHHFGDLPALQSNAQGHAHAEVSLPAASLNVSSAYNLLGRSLVIHRDLDDYVSQPAGNSGPRVACGVIVDGAGH